mmetsp:Transcript_14472/g.22333  ORF Transcript_14472/g.22333 Transcript_14472/m.22333 type:complete len:126 (+) Transcript_14472:266-643(+)
MPHCCSTHTPGSIVHWRKQHSALFHRDAIRLFGESGRVPWDGYAGWLLERRGSEASNQHASHGKSLERCLIDENQSLCRKENRPTNGTEAFCESVFGIKKRMLLSVTRQLVSSRLHHLFTATYLR